MPMKTLFSITLLLMITTLGYGQKKLDRLLGVFNSESIPYISVNELKRIKHNGEAFVLLDAREKSEYEVSSIPDAKFVGYSGFSLEETSKLLQDESTPIVVYCSLGIRSETIGEKLKKAGFTNVRNLYGGIIEWKNEGYTVVDPSGNETEKVHTSSRLWSKWLRNGEKVYD